MRPDLQGDSDLAFLRSKQDLRGVKAEAQTPPPCLPPALLDQGGGGERGAGKGEGSTEVSREHQEEGRRALSARGLWWELGFRLSCFSA